MSDFAPFDLTDLKLVYRSLHAHLMEHMELMDSDFFTALQSHLQQQARDQGVSVSDHAAWDGWLGNAITGCDVRMQQRVTLKS